MTRPYQYLPIAKAKERPKEAYEKCRDKFNTINLKLRYYNDAKTKKKRLLIFRLYYKVIKRASNFTSKVKDLKKHEFTQEFKRTKEKCKEVRNVVIPWRLCFPVFLKEGFK